MSKIANQKAFPKPAIFLHIQKTAGSTIVELARNSYGSKNVISHGDYFSELSGDFPLKSDSFFYHEYIQQKFGNIPFVSGHFGYTFAKTLIHNQNRYFFTFLRDPIERVLSFYYFCRTRDPNEFKIYALTQQLSLDEFLKLGFTDPDIRGFIWNCQTYQIADGFGTSLKLNLSQKKILRLAIKHLKEFSYVGFAETFEHDRDRILTDLGIVLPTAKVISNAGPDRPSFKDLPQSTQKLLLELTILDRQLYKKAWARKHSIFWKVISKWL